MFLHPEVWIRTVIQCAREERVEQKQQQRWLEGKFYLPPKVHLQEKDQKSLYSDFSSIPDFHQKRKKKILYILDFPSSKPFPLVNQPFLRNALLHPSSLATYFLFILNKDSLAGKSSSTLAKCSIALGVVQSLLLEH